jgi:hypothetical protein
MSRVALAVAMLFVTLVAGGAAAETHISIQYDSEERVELARRLLSELESQGYAVEIRTGAELTPCEANGPEAVTIARDAHAWIKLGVAPASGETTVASICYLGSLPLLQRATASAPRTDPGQLAVATAEALNGLRSKLPPVVREAAAPPRRETPTTAPAQPKLSSSLVNSVAVGAAVLFNAPHHPAAPAAVLQTNLGWNSAAGLQMDALIPTAGAELASPQVTATVRTTWLRLGPRLAWIAEDFKLAGALLAGPALSWATAVARAPRVGTTAVAAGAVLSLGATIEYPAHSPVFACVSGSASALVPNLRLKLGDGSRAPRGAWPVDAAVALGIRWGAEH